MKTLIIICFALFSASIGGTTSFAGGGFVDFKMHGIPLLDQSPALRSVFDKHFEFESQGILGPSDAPFDGARLYTYMDFQARSRGGDGQIFLIRLHFDRGEKRVIYTRVSFKRMEMFPVPASSVSDLATFRELYEATGANNTADSTAYSRESP